MLRIIMQATLNSLHSIPLSLVIRAILDNAAGTAVETVQGTRISSGNFLC